MTSPPGRAMHVLIAPTFFRGSLTTLQAANAMRTGVLAGLKEARVSLIPLADGGDGTLEVLAGHLRCHAHELAARDAIGRLRPARFVVEQDGHTAFVEAAEASGLRHLVDSERSVLTTSSVGAGELIRAAIQVGARRIVVGAGGSAAIDGGAGALTALGAVFRDQNGHAVEPIPPGLARATSVDLAAVEQLLSGVEIIVASDVRTTLRDNPVVFGPQKGIRRSDEAIVGSAIQALECLACRRGRPFADRPWCGAGGGLAGALYAFANARVIPGARYVFERLEVDRFAREADLVLTGEGSCDDSSMAGKVPAMLAERAADSGIPVVIIAGTVNLDTAKLPANTSVFGIARGPSDLEGLQRNASALVARTAENVVRLFAATGAVRRLRADAPLRE